jgi:2-dehydropantoate 2-reductase
MRIGIVGAGAIGGFIAGALARAGTQVGIVARGAHLASIRECGLKVHGDLGSFNIRLPAGENLAELEREMGAGPGGFDFLILTFKAHQWPALLPQLEPYARHVELEAQARTTLVTFQNGLPFWFERRPPLRSVDPGGKIGALFPDAQVIGGVVHASGNISEPGVIRQSGGMRYPLGDPSGGTSPRVLALCDIMRNAGLVPEAEPRIRVPVWLKLVNNVGLNSVSALTGLTIKPMLSNPDTREWVRTLMLEALDVGRAIGTVPGGSTTARIEDAVDVDARLQDASRLADVKTSMLQDVEAGRPLELDPILGAAIELGERHGVETPRLRDAYDRLKAKCR